MTTYQFYVKEQLKSEMEEGCKEKDTTVVPSA